jgi:hypothetical protein
MTSPTIFAQTSVSWFEDWREDGGTTEAAYSNTASAYDNAGKLIVASSVENASGGISLSLKKLGSTGNTIWSKVFNIVQTNKILVGNIAIDDSDNIHIAATMSSGSQTTADALVIKYNTSGVKLWHKTYNNPDNNYDGALDIALMANGDVIATGGSFRTTGQMNLLTMSIDSSGTLLWSNEYNNVGLHETGLKLTLTADTASITGITQLSAFNWEYIQQKILLTDGSTLDANVTDLGAGAINSVMDATQGEDGSYYIAGSVLTDTAGYDMKIIKFDTDFAPVWTATWDSEAHDDDFANAIEVRDNGTVYVTGYTNPADEHIVTLKFDSDGDLVWQKIRPGHGNGVTTNANGTVFVTGYTTTLGNNDFYIGVYDPDGEIIWEGGLNGAANKNDEGRVILVTPEGDIVVIGNSVDEDGDPGSLTAKYGYKTLVLPHGYEEKEVSTPFRENAGQLLDSDGEEAVDIEFYAGGSNPAPYLADDRLSWVFYLTDTSYATPDTAWRVDMSLPDAYLRETKIYGIGQQEYFENYYLAHIPEGKERVRQYQYLLHANAWDNTDLFYEQSGGEMVYRMVCHPGFDQENIRWSVSGYTSMSVNGSGELVIVTPLGDLVLPAPDAWQQDTMGNVITLPWNPYWSVTDEMAYIVMGGSYDTTKVVVVKVGEGEGLSPTAGGYWSTYFGNGGSEIVTSVEFDNSNEDFDIYATGSITSMTYPEANGEFTAMLPGSVSDAFAAKFTNDGIKFWLSYFGGVPPENVIGGNEQGNDIAPDNADNVYIVGQTNEYVDFPLFNSTGYNNSTTGSSGTRGFILKLDKELGFRNWGTFFGNSLASDDIVSTVTISPVNTVLIGGYFSEGSSSDLPVDNNNDPVYTSPTGTVYVAEFNFNTVNGNELVWSIPFTSQASYNQNKLSDIAVDAENNVYIVGTVFEATGQELPNINLGIGEVDNFFSGNSDGFIAKFDPDRHISWCSYFGGSDDEIIEGAACNSNGDLYIKGITGSDNLQQFGNGFHDPDGFQGGHGDAFVASFESDGTPSWFTYFGGEYEEGFASWWLGTSKNTYGNICISDNNFVFITGITESPDFPQFGNTSNEIFSSDINKGITSNSSDAYISIFDNNRNLAFSTFWGGWHHDRGFHIATDGDSRIVLCGSSISDNVLGDDFKMPLNKEVPGNDDFPGSFFQNNILGPLDGFISKLLIPLLVDNEEIGVVNAKENEFLFPNPSENYLNINFEYFANSFSLDTSIDILNMFGESIYCIPPASLKNQIDITTLPSGIYVVRIRINNEFHSQKIIKI